MNKYNHQYKKAIKLYRLPFLDLFDKARRVHKKNHSQRDIERCHLVSVKTGGCPEDCHYCPQSAHFKMSDIKRSQFTVEDFKNSVSIAKQVKASRICLAGAWKSPSQTEFQKVLEMIAYAKKEGLETCASLGSLTKQRAKDLASCGLDYYNHNIDTSKKYYSNIITTRSFEERLQTIQNVREAALKVCCGAILGLGENWSDRLSLLASLSSLSPYPESIPINMLIPSKGTPLEKQPPIESHVLIQVIAMARILMPTSKIRLSAGRDCLSLSEQALAILVGANSIFIGDKLLTQKNSSMDFDNKMINYLFEAEAKELKDGIL